MKTILLWGLSSIIVFGGIAAIAKNLRQPDLSNELSKPWIEVVQPAVFELAENQKDKVRELLTGDEIFEGAVISVESAGLANIHFPDGSVARLDGGTKLKMEKGTYDPKSDTLSVTLDLVWGRVWSKIVGLANAEAHWEVKTSTAVATVRGTAFGVEYIEEGKSSIVGYENKVEVAMIDPDTKKVMAGVKMLVEPEKLLEVRKEAVAEMKKHLARNDIKEAGSAVMNSAGALLMEVKQAPKAMMDKDWVKRGIEEDRKLEEKINQIKEKISDNVEARKELRKEIRENFQEKINDRREDFKKKIESPDQSRGADSGRLKNSAEKVDEVNVSLREMSQEDKNRETISAEAQKKTEFQAETTGTIKPAAVPTPLKLEILTKNPLGEVGEDERVFLQAFLSYSDGTRKDVTEGAKWQVVGEIGRMEKPGVFYAKLPPSVSELGVAPGAISAAWMDENGRAFSGQTPIFKVQMLIDTNFDPNRG